MVYMVTQAALEKYGEATEQDHREDTLCRACLSDPTDSLPKRQSQARRGLDGHIRLRTSSALHIELT